MFRAARARAVGRDHGFTLIELLVVVIIIGILAAIAIPVYIGVQRSANDADAESWVVTSSKKLSLYYTQNGTFAPTLADADITVPANLTTRYFVSSTSFCLSGFHVDSPGQSGRYGPTANTWKTVVIPAQSSRRSFNPKNPDSTCVHASG